MTTNFSFTKKVYRNLHLSKGQIAIIIAVIITCLATETLFFSVESSLLKKSEIYKAKIYGETIVSNIELSIDEGINVSEVLKYLYIDYKDNLNELETPFYRRSSHLISANPTINSILIAPKGIIEYAYPFDISEESFGRNILKDEEYEKGAARKSLETKETTVSGPFKVKDGKNIFVIVNPIFDDNEFSALVLVILDWGKLVNKIIKNLNLQNSEYDFAIWKDNNIDNTVDNYGFIINNSKKAISKSVTLEIKLPNEIWHLSTEPKSGWINKRKLLIELILFSFAMLVIIGLVIFRQYDNAKKVYAFEHDFLTGLYTRSAFYRRIKKLFEDFPNEDFDIIASDIENFKVLNSIYGTKKCDTLLCYLANEFQKIDCHSVFCRFSGDIFMCIVKSKNNISIDELYNRAKSIEKNSPIPNISVKYGWYGHIDKTIPINQLCDRALIAAKSILHKYDKTIMTYEGPISHKHLQEQVIESSFGDAIKNGNFKVWFQPKFDTKTEKLVGAEALVRWEKDDGTIVSPKDFIYVFENDGLIVRLDEYVFRKVCSIVKNWLDEGISVVPVSVNISRATLHHEGTIEKYKKIIEEFNIPIELIPLEITESTEYTSKQIEELASKLKETGFRIDMDDFGTGFSSLASLNIIPFDVVKIDKSLVDFIGTPDGDEIIKHAIEIVHFKKIHVVAEGVEKKEQLDFLKSLNCESIQGYYFSPPMPYEKCLDFIKKLQKEDRILNIS